MNQPTFVEAVVRALATEKSFQRGLELYRSGAIYYATIQGNTLRGECEGTQLPFYQVTAELDGGGVRAASCTCPYDWGGYCKHVVALLLAYIHAPEQFIARKQPAELLADLNREQLLSLITKLLEKHPDLYERLQAQIDSPATSARGKTKAVKRKKVDKAAYRSRVRSILHSLDHMRMSEAYWHVGGLVEQLDSVKDTAMEFLNAGDGEAALETLLALLEESHDGFDYIDDSNGELGDFLSGLGEVLAEVILSLDLDEDRREDLTSDLEDLHSRLSDYGIDGLSVAVAAAEYGWNGISQESSSPDADEDEDRLQEADALELSSDYVERALIHAKLNVLGRQERTDEYLALCQKTGEHLRYALKLCEFDRVAEAVSHALKHLADAGEALELSECLRESGHLEESIRIGEHGLNLPGPKAALGEWLGPIQEAQGRTS